MHNTMHQQKPRLMHKMRLFLQNNTDQPRWTQFIHHVLYDAKLSSGLDNYVSLFTNVSVHVKGPDMPRVACTSTYSGLVASG
jgi:hypothetical protein